MNEIVFEKYQGTGNDFIIIDDRQKLIQTDNQALIQKMCDRRLGIGADGLILLRPSERHDFQMVYFNADGKQSTMCGNGGRCISAFAQAKGVMNSRSTFEAIDGLHQSMVLSDGSITLTMQDIEQLEQQQEDFIIDTGSPHFVRFVDDIKAVQCKTEGRAIRNNEQFKTEGINVDFTCIVDEHHIQVKTYERGVENETLSCGTGVVAAAICTHRKLNKTNEYGHYIVDTRGGRLTVTFDYNDETKSFTNVCLTGSAKFVFKGIYIPTT